MKRAKRSVLGDLEMAVLDHLWKVNQADAKAVHLIVGTSRNISLNTVQSTLERLYRKGLLGREKVSHAFVYEPCIARAELMAQIIDDIVQPISKGEAEPFLAAFVEYAARVDIKALDRLEKIISARRVNQGSETNK